MWLKTARRRSGSEPTTSHGPGLVSVLASLPTTVDPTKLHLPDKKLLRKQSSATFVLFVKRLTSEARSRETQKAFSGPLSG